jgi:high affinity sulfate transporter 1
MTPTRIDIATWWHAGVAGVMAVLPRRRDLRSMLRSPRRDIVAGITVAVVALPLALAFGAASGLGAGAGLVTAIVAGSVAALLGGSNLQVSGPTGAMTVVLVPIVAQFGPQAVLTVGVLAGLFLLALALARAGRVMRYIPVPVVEGFTVGIAVIIALQQVPPALGVEGEGEKVLLSAMDAALTWVHDPQWWPVLVTVGVAAAMLLGARLLPKIPLSLVATVVATVVVVAAQAPVALIGPVPSSLPAPSLPPFSPALVSALVLPAVAVAALAALESLLSATVADAMTVGQHHDPDRELFGQGMANLASPLFGGLPATAAIARTAVNVRSGARSRLAAFTHAVVLLLIVLVAAQWVAQIPLAALAGVLIATAVQMVEVSSVWALLRATRGDAAVLVVTALATVMLDLVTAVILGLVVAGLIALRDVARGARLDETPVTSEGDDEEERLLSENIVAYRLDGPLFFGAAHTFLLELSEVGDVRVVILRMSRVLSLDATGAAVLADTIGRLERRHVTVLLSGVRPEHLRVLAALGLYDNLAHERHLFDSTPDAIEHARVHARRAAHDPSAPSH